MYDFDEEARRIKSALQGLTEARRRQLLDLLELMIGRDGHPIGTKLGRPDDPSEAPQGPGEFSPTRR